MLQVKPHISSGGLFGVGARRNLLASEQQTSDSFAEAYNAHPDTHNGAAYLSYYHVDLYFSARAVARENRTRTHVCRDEQGR